MKIIIVEDSGLIRERILQLPMVKVSEVVGITDSYQDAINLINELSPDTIILDLFLTASSGIEVLKYIRKNQIGCKIIVLTNHNIPVIKMYCLNLGADYFFDKANEFNKVDEVLNDLMTSDKCIE
jgi:DNA-binding NarL/FixJ family response regulator